VNDGKRLQKAKWQFKRQYPVMFLDTVAGNEERTKEEGLIDTRKGRDYAALTTAGTGTRYEYKCNSSWLTSGNL